MNSDQAFKTQAFRLSTHLPRANLTPAVEPASNADPALYQKTISRNTKPRTHAWDSKPEDSRLRLTRQLIRTDGDWARVTRSSGINHSHSALLRVLMSKG